MAVKVTIKHSSPAQSELSDSYPKGRGVFVSNGHLIVGDHPHQQQAETIAVYAPGKWDIAAVVEDGA